MGKVKLLRKTREGGFLLFAENEFVLRGDPEDLPEKVSTGQRMPFSLRSFQSLCFFEVMRVQEREGFPGQRVELRFFQ